MANETTPLPLVPGGLYKSAAGDYINANGEPVDTSVLSADVRKAYGVPAPAKAKA